MSLSHSLFHSLTLSPFLSHSLCVSHSLSYSVYICFSLCVRPQHRHPWCLFSGLDPRGSSGDRALIAISLFTAVCFCQAGADRWCNHIEMWENAHTIPPERCAVIDDWMWWCLWASKPKHWQHAACSLPPAWEECTSSPTGSLLGDLGWGMASWAGWHDPT